MTVAPSAVLYIAGTGRSGSTLLARLLGAYRGFLPVGELRYLWDRGLAENHLCGCRVPFRSCPFWSEVLTRAFGGVSEAERLDVPRLAKAVDRIRHVPELTVAGLRTPGFRRAFADYADVLGRLYASILEVAPGSVVVDSSKDPSYAFVLDAVAGVDASFVHLVRDSRAVAHSWTRRRPRPEIHWTTEHMHQRPAVRSGYKWNQHQLLVEVLRLTRPRFALLRYEDLVDDAEASVARLAALASGSQPPALLEAGEAPFLHNISGNPIRFDGPAPVLADDEWRQALGRRDRRAVTLVTAPLLLRYGYLRPR
ncbi:MAG: hypothetical protein V7605_997 [Acidimicrobiaceae bacterium]|jgi:hypothetical protein